MAEHRLYSVAAIAKLLDMPESTLHYWKNRFEDVLPSVGRGRNKRYRPEAVEIFRSIAVLLDQGLSAADVRAELVRQYPVNVAHEPAAAPRGAVESPARAEAVATSGNGSGDGEAVMAMAAGIGTEIARALLAQFHPYMTPPAPALPEETVEGLRAELAAVRGEHAAMTEKMRLLETELVRLRKDRRELESYLVDKINALRRAGEVS